MFIFRSAALLLTVVTCTAQRPDSLSPGLGRALTAEEIRKIDIGIASDGSGLPPGSGSVVTGLAVYQQKCLACHGSQGEGKPQDRLTGGIGTLATDKPVKTPASFWPRATTLFDYIRRAMPLNQPQSLTNNEVYAVTAYLLSVDGIVPKDAIMDAKSLPQVRMPNREGFVSYWPSPPKP